ncbi:12-oxophytodienoate reductase 1 [Nicotiana attenuata]|uniref:12-oxophytodienoate reductase 1 n=1 Tax=Nicotiana attenuata TaxID=49451 RepID=A0A1J6ICH0_NICAT|nr:12-oxophytodienoate reductase 1 [Nicotiana attenuata]
MAAKSTSVPLLTPYKMGSFELSHRVVMPPMTRNRSYNNTPQPHATEYFAQRATKGGFLISESTSASNISKGSPNMPGIWTEDQIEAWKPIVESIHGKGGIFFCQLWHPGRLSDSSLNNFLIAWNAVPDDGEYFRPTPKQLSASELPFIVNDFRIAARNAIKAVYGKKDSNPEALATYLASELTKLGVLYLHVFEPREEHHDCLKSIRMAFEGTLIASGGYNKTKGDEAIAESCADLVSFGRLFLANPDLPKRFEVNAPLNKHDRSSFYRTDPVVGYTYYPSLEATY